MLAGKTPTNGCRVLRELRVENYAVIDNVVVEFGAGLNLLTGETGAGKSILIDALALLLGEKAYSDVVRHGAEKATVAAVYECGDSSDAADEAAAIARSEEHTSELQSLRHLVCRLLLEKKKME